ncbi:unnamed protein product [Penicillium pancosmium]
MKQDADYSSDRWELPATTIDLGMVNPEESVIREDEFGQIDPTEWLSQYNHCVLYFVHRSQHTLNVQSIAAALNIRLPFHRPSNVVAATPSPQLAGQISFVSLRSYIRRLIVTAQDTPVNLRAFFGDNWEAGVGCIYKQERVNYLFAAKSGGWASAKAAYDILPDEQTPFLRPLLGPSDDEIRKAEDNYF